MERTPFFNPMLRGTAPARKKVSGASIHRFAGSCSTLVAVGAVIASASPAAHAKDLSKIAPDLAASLKPASLASGKAKFNTFGKAGKTSASAVAEPRFRVLVRLNENASVGNLMTAKRIRAQVGLMGRTFANTNMAVVEATPSELLALSDDPTVASISPDRAVSFTADLDVNRKATGADVAGQSISNPVTRNGKGINVAVLDSGIAPVPDLAPAILGFKDIVHNQTTAYDDFGHGTHVAGIIAGNGVSSSAAGATTTYKGIAYGSKLIGVKVLESDGSGTTANIVAGIDWCIANKAYYKIRIINLSLSGGVWESYHTDPMCQAAERATHAGILVVAAAGNVGGMYGAVGSPANDPDVLAVGASNSRNTVGRDDDVVTSYSSRGPSRFDLSIKPDVVAPGNQIVSVRAPGSTLDTLYPATQVPTSEYTTAGGNTAYTRLSGTSMAAPMVSAAAALVLQTNASLYPNGVKAALMFTAQPLSGYDPVRNVTGVYDPLTQGAGEINIPGAVEVSNLMKPLGLTANPSFTTQIGGASVPWLGASLPTLLTRTGGVSANNLIWGGHIDLVPAPADNAIWASNLIWGGHIDFSDELVWGANLIWGGHIDLNGQTDLALDAPDAPDLLWANNLIWGGHIDFMDADPDPAVNATNLIWGGHIDVANAAPSDPGANNLIWGGHIDVSANNLIWGGHIDFTGDDPVDPFPAEEGQQP